MIKDLLKETEDRMKSTLSVLEDDLAALRTGRASTAFVEKLPIEYYGTPTPLYQLASISVPEPQAIMIRPFDRGSLGTIEKAILASDLGLTPNNDGTNIRLNIPPLTQERRKQLVKFVGKRVEDAKVAIRNIRRSANDDIRDFEKEGLISEDDMHGGTEKVQDLTNKYIAEIDKAGKRKEHEIMEV